MMMCEVKTTNNLLKGLLEIYANTEQLPGQIPVCQLWSAMSTLYAYARISYMCCQIEGCFVAGRVTSYDLCLHFIKIFFLAPSLPFFTVFNIVAGACFPYCVGAHGWVCRICWPWEQSPSRSWLPIVDTP